MPKSEIQDLVNSEDQVPYFAQRFHFIGCDINGGDAAVVYKTNGFYYLNDWNIAAENNKESVAAVKCKTRAFLDTEEDCIYLGYCVNPSSNNNAKFVLDEFGLGKQQSDYKYMDGTSMACPIVSGILGSVYRYLGGNTAEDALKTAAYVKGSVNQNPDLDTKSVSGGIVDFDSAMSGLNGSEDRHIPVLQDIQVSKMEQGYQIVVNGYFFGNNPGSVFFDNQSVQVEQWSDSSISFTINACEQHMAKIVVSNAKGRTGRNFFEIKTESIGYEDLPISDITYKDKNGNIFKTEDLDPLKSATTDTAMYVLYGEKDLPITVMEKFNYSSKTWKKMDLSGLTGFVETGMRSYYSMASGKDEFYLLYLSNGANNQDECMWLATFSEKENKFVDNISLKGVAEPGDMLCNVKRGLWLAGKDKLGLKDREYDVVSIDPVTGTIVSNITNFPEYDFMVSGNMSVYGNNVVIADSATNSTLEPITWGRDKVFNEPFIYDGKSWTTSRINLYEDTQIADKEQFLCSGGVAISTGVLEVGMVSNNATTKMADNFLLDFSDYKWEPALDIRYSSYKCRSYSAICHNNKVYVCAKNGSDFKSSFKCLSLSKIGAYNDDVANNVEKIGQKI